MRTFARASCWRFARASVRLPARAGVARTVLDGGSSQRGARRSSPLATQALLARHGPRQLRPVHPLTSAARWTPNILCGRSARSRHAGAPS
eukprot:13934240-Alexandrium_andersonii.AAC.1